jgi:hypothetical protein
MEIEQPHQMPDEYQNTIELPDQPENPEKRTYHSKIGCQDITDSAYISTLSYEVSKTPFTLENQNQKKSRPSPKNQEASSPADPSDES